MAAPNRRRLRFSLRTMLVAFTVVAMWLVWNVHRIRQRRVALDDPSRYWPTLIEPASSLPGPQASIPWYRRLMGDRAVKSIWVHPSATSDDLERAVKLFPEAEVTRFKMPSDPRYW